MPVGFEEPDVTCHVDGLKVGVAAKRLKNVSNLEKRIRKAAKQIKGTRLPGIIALDTCIALNRDNERIDLPMPDDQFSQLYNESMRQFLDDFHFKIYNWVDDTPVRGLAFHDHQVRIRQNGQWGLDSMTFWLQIPTNDEQATREFEAFRDQYVKGLPNLEYV